MNKMLMNYSVLNNFCRAQAKYSFATYILNKYNKYMTPEDFYSLIGFRDMLKGELKASFLSDMNNYEVLKTTGENEIKKIREKYYTRGKEIWALRKAATPKSPGGE